MADYILKQIDMIGQLLRALAKKLGIGGDDTPDYDLETIKQKAQELDSMIDFNEIIAANNPALYMTNSLGYTDDAIETFAEIIMNSKADEATKAKVLDSVLVYLDNKGQFSFSLHAFKA